MNEPLSDLLAQAKGFDWDTANIEKNWRRHQVSHIECEETFFNEPLVLAFDESHSQAEKRYIALGKTDFGRLLFIAFTIRQGKIRVISARNMSKNERMHYR